MLLFIKFFPITLDIKILYNLISYVIYFAWEIKTPKVNIYITNIAKSKKPINMYDEDGSVFRLNKTSCYYLL